MANPKIRQAGIVEVTFGENVTVVEPVNLYGCHIGDGTFVGPFVEIQRGASIGRRCKFCSWPAHIARVLSSTPTKRALFSTSLFWSNS